MVLRLSLAQRVTLILPGVLLSACSTSLTALPESVLAQKAKAGDAQAQYVLAGILAARRDYPQALTLMKLAASQSASSDASKATRGDAARQAGDWYHAGLGEPRNELLARHWWTRASSLGNAQASMNLAGLCQAPQGDSPAESCISLYETAARQGSAQAQLMLARWYQTQPSGEKTALVWLQKAAAQGEPAALMLLARRYETGNGVEKSAEIARRDYRQSAAPGNPQAQRWMAEHSEGAERLSWYQKAAQGGDVRAQRVLAQAYLSGSGVPQNDTEGLSWLKRAVSQGDARALYLYSQYQQSDELRLQYLTLSAKGGDLQAACALARWYDAQGDEANARSAWLQLAERGDPEGRYHYGEMLRLGTGGKPDYTRAFKQYRLSAMAGNRMAQYRTGMMSQAGLGLPRNRIQAYAWYSLAATENMKVAVDALNAMEAELKPDEIQAAQKLAREWSLRITQEKNDDSR
ncbi:TPA: sel1 repeat family protein [Enterobacter ludwigii]|uniref:tetratricopeptide repeat protein n=1 Tax=Enterobacter ludwigii TaxID=299767 RepID=UPI0033021B7A|nr:sel1 repeat family protein [Enterobacter ludwigii]HDR2596144.1 sel1 repeat family protein [Enterobacter ludwigii]